jgi:hypothetical protein
MLARVACVLTLLRSGAERFREYFPSVYLSFVFTSEEHDAGTTLCLNPTKNIQTYIVLVLGV